MNKISKEECIKEIKRLYDEYGQVTKPILKLHGTLSYETIKRRFGDIETALIECDVPLVNGQHKMIDKQIIVDDIKRVHNLIGYISKPVYEKHGNYNQKVIKRIFGNFANMYKELGFQQHPSGYIASDEELINDLKALYETHDMVSAQIIKQYGNFSVTTYTERFGSINEAYELANMPTRNAGDSSMATYTINKFAKVLNEQPIFEQTFDWLINYKTNRKLPIDGYFPNANIAIEYNGPQHYIVDGRYTPTLKDLEYRQWLDSIKYDLIRNHGIHLIVIPYTDKVSEQYILNNIGNMG